MYDAARVVAWVAMVVMRTECSEYKVYSDDSKDVWQNGLDHLGKGVAAVICIDENCGRRNRYQYKTDAPTKQNVHNAASERIDIDMPATHECDGWQVYGYLAWIQWHKQTHEQTE